MPISYDRARSVLGFRLDLKRIARPMILNLKQQKLVDGF
jgi:hypothetical protein